MPAQLDAFAHRRLAQSTKTLVALLVYPPSSVGFVLSQLRNCLFDFRGVRNVRSRMVCVSATEVEGKNAKKERDVKVLLLSEEFLTPASVQSFNPLCEMQEETNSVKTVENMSFVSLEELLTLQNADPENESNMTNNNYFPSVLRDRLCLGLTGGGNNKHNLMKNKNYMNSQFALATFTIHLTYVNYTMPELLKMVIEHYKCNQLLTEEPSTNDNNDNHSLVCKDEKTNNNFIKSNIAILSGFEQVGHIAHVNLAESHLPFALCIGQVILDCNPNIHVVVNKVESIATTFREFKMDVIALRERAIQCLLYEYIHTHAKYGTSVQFVDLSTRVDMVKKYMSEELCLTDHSTLEHKKVAVQKQEIHNGNEKNEKGANGKLYSRKNSNQITYDHDDSNNDVNFNVKEFMHTCMSDTLMDALLTSTVKQEGCLFTVPYNKVYWNSRLGHEHSLLVSQMSSHDVLFDVMAGVGPFAIPAALRGLTVFANDLNPFAAAYMQFNRAANHLYESSMHVCNMDGREFMRTELLTEFVKDLKLYYSTVMTMMHEQQHHCQENNSKPSRQFHVVMNLPALAVTFLDVFAPHGEEWGANELRRLLREEEETMDAKSNHMEQNAAQNSQNLQNNNNKDDMVNKTQHENKDGVKSQLMKWLQHKCIIHIYCFSSAEDVCADAVKQVEHHIGYSLHTGESGEMCNARLVRDVSPLKRMICVSFSLPRMFWQRYFMEHKAIKIIVAQ